MLVSLNDELLGDEDLGVPSWTTLAFRAPSGAWRFGNNVLRLELMSAVSPRELGISEDDRKLAVAVDRIAVEAWAPQSQ